MPKVTEVVSDTRPMTASIGAEVQVLTSRGQVFLNETTVDASAGSSLGGAMLSVAVPDIQDARVLTGLWTESVVPAVSSEDHESDDWVTGAAQPVTFDDRASGLGTVVGTPSIDVSNHAVTWTSDTTAEPMNGVLVQFGVTRSGSNGSADTWVWGIGGPGELGRLALPVLPIDGFDFNLRPSDTTHIYLIERFDVPGGFAALRGPFPLVSVDTTSARLERSRWTPG
jgi:hypothetical protein